MARAVVEFVTFGKREAGVTRVFSFLAGRDFETLNGPVRELLNEGDSGLQSNAWATK